MARGKELDSRPQLQVYENTPADDLDAIIKQTVARGDAFLDKKTEILNQPDPKTKEALAALYIVDYALKIYVPWIFLANLLLDKKRQAEAQGGAIASHLTLAWPILTENRKHNGNRLSDLWAPTTTKNQVVSFQSPDDYATASDDDDGDILELDMKDLDGEWDLGDELIIPNFEF